MSHFGHEVPQTMVTLLTKAVGAFVLLVVFFIFRYIFELEFTCSCSPGIDTIGVIYMVVPPFIIYLLLYAMNRKYQRLFCCGGWNHVWSFLTQQCLQFLSIGLFWVAAVFMDGDWYVCLMGNLDEKHMRIPCMKKDNLTYEENMFIVNNKNQSIVIGLSMTLVGVFFWAIWSCFLIKWNCSQPYYRRIYDDYLSQETEASLRAALTEVAQERAKAVIQKSIKTIRETERRKKQTSGENNNAEQTAEEAWNSTSKLDFYQSERDESYKMSLFNGHLQKEADVAISDSLQEMAKDQVTVTNQRQFENFIRELTKVKTRVQSTQTSSDPEPDSS